jgi:hypothetical protein
VPALPSMVAAQSKMLSPFGKADTPSTGCIIRPCSSCVSLQQRAARQWAVAPAAGDGQALVRLAAACVVARRREAAPAGGCRTVWSRRRIPWREASSGSAVGALRRLRAGSVVRARAVGKTRPVLMLVRPEPFLRWPAKTSSLPLLQKTGNPGANSGNRHRTVQSVDKYCKYC